MEIRDTIQSDDIRCDGWIDKDTAEASIRQTEATLKCYTPVYDAQCKEYPRGVEPFRDCIFAEALLKHLTPQILMHELQN